MFKPLFATLLTQTVVIAQRHLQMTPPPAILDKQPVSEVPTFPVKETEPIVPKFPETVEQP